MNETTLEGSENDSDTNLSYDDSSSISVPSIESTYIICINEGDDEDDKENQDHPPLPRTEIILPTLHQKHAEASGIGRTQTIEPCWSQERTAKIGKCYKQKINLEE